MRGWIGAVAGLGMLVTGAMPAVAGGPLSGTWKGTASLSDSKPVHVELRINQQGGVFKGTGVGCDQVDVPGCPPGSAQGVVTFKGIFLSPVQAGEFTMRLEPPTVKTPLLAAPAAQPAACVYFVSATGSVSADGESLNFLMRGQDNDCNPILGLINATKE